MRRSDQEVERTTEAAIDEVRNTASRVVVDVRPTLQQRQGCRAAEQHKAFSTKAYHHSRCKPECGNWPHTHGKSWTGTTGCWGLAASWRLQDTIQPKGCIIINTVKLAWKCAATVEGVWRKLGCHKSQWKPRSVEFVGVNRVNEEPATVAQRSAQQRHIAAWRAENTFW